MAKSPISVPRFRLTFITCWLVWAALHAYLLTRFGFRFNTAVMDSFVNNGLLCVASLMLSNNLGYYRPKEEKYYILLAWGVGLVGICIGITHAILQSMLTGENGYKSFLQQSLPVRFCVGILLLGFTAMVSMLWYNLDEQQENEKRKNSAEKLARDAELYNLRQQLQPHFLFNSLNSISALICVEPEQARKMIQQLSDFLRGSIKKDEQTRVPLSDELEYLQLYLDIEKVRFGHRLTTIINCDNTSPALYIPSLILQPIVENAIKFGLYDTTEEVTIRIDCEAITNEASKRDLVLKVTNPFDPETSSPRRGTGFGLNSVQRRLYLLYARNDLLSTSASNNLFTTTIKIPQIHDQSYPD
jgi:two-component system LytT family sensor kinase